MANWYDDWVGKDGYLTSLKDGWSGKQTPTMKLDSITGKMVPTGGTTTTAGYGGIVMDGIGAIQGWQQGQRAEEMLDMYRDTSAFDMYMKRANMKMKLGDATESTNMRQSSREANRQINAQGGGRLSTVQDSAIADSYLNQDTVRSSFVNSDGSYRDAYTLPDVADYAKKTSVNPNSGGPVQTTPSPVKQSAFAGNGVPRVSNPVSRPASTPSSTRPQSAQRVSQSSSKKKRLA